MTWRSDTAQLAAGLTSKMPSLCSLLEDFSKDSYYAKEYVLRSWLTYALMYTNGTLYHSTSIWVYIIVDLGAVSWGKTKLQKCSNS